MNQTSMYSWHTLPPTYFGVKRLGGLFAFLPARRASSLWATALTFTAASAWVLPAAVQTSSALPAAPPAPCAVQILVQKAAPVSSHSCCDCQTMPPSSTHVIV